MHITNPPKPDTLPTTTEDNQQVGLLALRAARKRRKLMIGAGVVAMIALGLAGREFLSPAPTVNVVQLKSQPAERVLAVTGRVKPRETVQIYPKVGGQILALMKDEGALVQEGEVLGQIDPARAKTTLTQTNAALEAQRRVLAQAERDLDRARTLLNRGTTTIAGVESATLAVSKGREDLRRLEAARDEAKLRLEENTIVAPFTGRILNRPVDPGQVVETRTALFEIAPTAAQEIETEVDEAYSMAIKLGQDARLALAGINEPVTGKVSYLAPEIKTSTGGRLVRLAFEPPATVSGQELPVGLSVDVNIIVDRTNAAVTVPRQSIRNIATDPKVLVVKDGKIAEQAIAFVDWPSSSVIVTKGLNAGDKVIVSPKAPAVGTAVTTESAK